MEVSLQKIALWSLLLTLENQMTRQLMVVDEEKLLRTLVEVQEVV